MLQRIALLLVGFGLLAEVPAAAQQASCLTADPPAPAAAPAPLQFGVTPRIAGSAGALQGAAAPEDLDRTGAELRALRPGGRTLVLRLNRLFWADGREGIDEGIQPAGLQPAALGQRGRADLDDGASSGGDRRPAAERPGHLQLRLDI